MKFSQTELGDKLGFSAMAISRWERGVQEPPSRSYIQLGNMVGGPHSWYFWGRAGLDSGDVISVLPAAKPARPGLFAPGLDIVIGGNGSLRMKNRRARLVAISLFKASGGAHSQRGSKTLKLHELLAVNAIATRSNWCPNPSRTSCLRVRSDSMMPLMDAGHILAVDTSFFEAAELYGTIVIAGHKARGLMVSRLRRIGRLDVLVSENPKYDSISIGRKSGWKLVGKVLWWIGKPK